MIVLISLSALCTLGYLSLLGYYYYHWKPVIPQSKQEADLPLCSILIPARNEETQIGNCLQAVTTQTYPTHRYEVIVIDDGSEDNTVKLVSAFPTVKLLHTREGQRGKKHALVAGITAASGEIIVTTDADCIVNSEWLHSLVSTFDDHTHMVTGPVLLHPPQKMFARFQALDLTSLAMITAAGIQSGFHHLANGANMAFRKSTFDAVGGFSGNMSLASGDDIFLVQSIAKAVPGSIRYAGTKTAVAYTEPCRTLQSFLHQRLRWATKNKSLREKSVFWVWAFIWTVFTLNLATLLISPFHGYLFVLAAAIPITLIAIAQYIFLQKGVFYYGQSGLMKGFLLSFLLHYLYVIYIGIASLLTKRYWWKGRKVY